MNISIQVDDRAVREAFRKAPAKTVSALSNWVGTAAAMTERIEKMEVPVDKGVLQNSVHIINSGLKAEVKPVAKYSIWVHEGTGIYGPRKRAIMPIKGKYLVFEVGGQKIFARSVRGQRPNRFADRTYKLVRPQAEQRANQMISDLVRSI